MRKLWVDLGAMQQADQTVRSRHQIGVEGVKTPPDVPVAVMHQRLRTVQLFRHEAAHLAGVLQAYMQGQLLGKCWQQLQSSVQVNTCSAQTVNCDAPMHPAHTQHEQMHRMQLVILHVSAVHDSLQCSQIVGSDICTDTVFRALIQTRTDALSHQTRSGPCK